MQGFFRGSALQRTGDDFVRGLPKCGICKFAPHCESPRMEVGGEGTNGVLVVGEHPGEEEDRRGKHFVGETSALLGEAFKAAGQRLRDCSLTYAMICKPNREVTDKNVIACRPSLLTTIDRLKPKVVILLGPSPLRSLVPAERGGSVGAHKRWIGYAIPSNQHGAWLCPTYSPAQVAKFGGDETILKYWHDHIAKAFALVDVPPTSLTMKQLWDRVETITSPRLARKRLVDLAKKEGVLAFDYESNRIKPDHPKAKLAAASFCLNGVDTFSVLLDRDETLRAVSPVLRSKRLRKVASNLKNEERWTRAKLGHGVESWYWDTMLAAHALDNRGQISSIKFQAFIHFGVPDYDRFVEPYFESGPDGFNKVFEMDHKDLLNYNALDSLLEYMVCTRQRPKFGFPVVPDPEEWFE